MHSQAARLYADGLRDGIALTLKLVIGEQHDSGGVPYPHPEKLPPDFISWVRSAIVKVEDDRLTTPAVEEALYRVRPSR